MTTMETRQLLLGFAFAVASLPPATAFGVPHSIAAGPGSLLATSFAPPSILLSDDGVASLADSAEATQAIVETSAAQATQAVVETSRALEETGGGGGLFDTLKNVLVVVTAVLFLGASLAYLVASVIVPAAAKELEKECKELAPELWDQYTALLEDGETMASRPDLLQELGQKLQPLIDAKVERQFAEQKEKGIDVSEDEAAWRAFDNFSLTDKKRSVEPQAAEPGVDISIKDQWVDAEVSEREIVVETTPAPP